MPKSRKILKDRAKRQLFDNRHVWWKCDKIKLPRTLASRCRLGKRVGLSQESSIGWRSWDDWGESSQLLSTDLSWSFFSFSQMIAISLNLFLGVSNAGNPCEGIVLKRSSPNLCWNKSGSVNIPGKMWDNWQRWWLKTIIFKVRGYKPAPVAWPKISEEVDDLGRRMSRCQIFM